MNPKFSHSPEFASRVSSTASEKSHNVTEEQAAEWSRIALRYALSMLSRDANAKETANDIAQTAVMLAIKNYPQFRGQSDVNTWLHRIVENCKNDHYRRQNRGAIKFIMNWEDLSPEAQQIAALAGQPMSDSALALRLHQQRELTRVMSFLTEYEKKLLKLRYLDGLSVKEIASSNNVNEETMKVRFFRLRKKIEKYFQNYQIQKKTRVRFSPKDFLANLKVRELRKLITDLNLNAQEKEIVAAKYFEGLTPEEIGGKLGVTAESVVKGLKKVSQKVISHAKKKSNFPGS